MSYLASYTRTCNIFLVIFLMDTMRDHFMTISFLFANVLYSQHSTWPQLKNPVNTAFPSLVTYVYGIHEDYDAHVPRIWLRGTRLWLRLAYHIYNTSATKRNQNGVGRRPFYDMWQARHTVTKYFLAQ